MARCTEIATAPGGVEHDRINAAEGGAGLQFPGIEIAAGAQARLEILVFGQADGGGQCATGGERGVKVAAKPFIGRPGEVADEPVFGAGNRGQANVRIAVFAAGIGRCRQGEGRRLPGHRLGNLDALYGEAFQHVAVKRRAAAAIRPCLRRRGHGLAKQRDGVTVQPFDAQGPGKQ